MPPLSSAWWTALLALTLLLALCARSLPRSADGGSLAPFAHCSLAFVDLGAGSGGRIRELLEPARYPSGASQPAFVEAFGADAALRRDVCAFGVEARPRHAARLHALADAYACGSFHSFCAAPQGPFRAVRLTFLCSVALLGCDAAETSARRSPQVIVRDVRGW